MQKYKCKASNNEGVWNRNQRPPKYKRFRNMYEVKMEK